MSGKKSILRQPAFWAMVALVTLTATEPAHAQTANIQSFADNIKSWLTGALAKSIAVIALAVCGYRFFSGRASAGPLVAVLGGIALIFGADYILNTMTGG